MFVKYTDTITNECFYCTCNPIEIHYLERVNKKLKLWCHGRILAREISNVPFIYTLRDLKNELRMNDYTGDRWGVSMSAFFDLCAVTYERIDLPCEWEFRPGWHGNHIEEDNMLLNWDKEISDDELLLF